MADLQRVDLLLPKTLIKHLKKEAQTQHTTFSALVRDNLQRCFMHSGSRSTRMDAVRRIRAMSLPVGPWEKMVSDIDRGRTA